MRKSRRDYDEVAAQNRRYREMVSLTLRPVNRPKEQPNPFDQGVAEALKLSEKFRQRLEDHRKS